MRNTRPKTTARQIAEGDPRKIGKNKLLEKLAAEPKATSGLPACPAHLKGRAKAAWKLWAEELAVMEIDKRPDAMMLEGACVLFGRAVEADRILAREGLTVEESILTKEGEKVVLKTKAHPIIAVSETAWRQCRMFCVEFGFTPVSRTRLAIEKKDDGAGDLAAMLSRPRQPKTAAPDPPPAVN